MQNVYEVCPIFENEKYLLRFVHEEDCQDLLNVYSDKAAVPFFNSDNCNGDDFYYATEERMKQAIDFWIFSYKEGYFVRWSIIDKEKGEAIGTIELFHRDADDYFPECGLLRLDIRSDYEKASEIESILSLILSPTFDMFYCNKIATKATSAASERICALETMNFALSDKKLVGNDGTEYGDYYVLEKR